MHLACARNTDSIAACTCSFERVAMVDKIAGKLDLYWALQRLRRPVIWYPHSFTGVLLA